MAAFRHGRVAAVIESTDRIIRALVETELGELSAVGFPNMLGPLNDGDEVVVNTTGIELGLGTGGVAFILWNVSSSEVPPPGELLHPGVQGAAPHAGVLGHGHQTCQTGADRGKKLYPSRAAFVNRDKDLRSLPEVFETARFRADEPDLPRYTPVRRQRLCGLATPTRRPLGAGRI